MYTKVKFENRMGKEHFGGLCTTGNNTKMDLKETGCDSMKWIQLTASLVAGYCIVSNENLEFTKMGNFLIR